MKRYIKIYNGGKENKRKENNEAAEMVLTDNRKKAEVNIFIMLLFLCKGK